MPKRRNMFLIVAIFAYLSAVANSSSSQTCADTRNYFYKAVGVVEHIPTVAISGQNLKVCATGVTCCTVEMEDRFLKHAQQQYQQAIGENIVNLVHSFKARTDSFDRFFRELLSKSQRDLHSMFVKTYGVLYEQNSDLFVSLFENLTQFYEQQRRDGPAAPAVGVNLDLVLDRFYENLYRRMFHILNQPYQLDDSYWQCMSRQMQQLQPFGQVPDKMKMQVHRAFSAARTFIHALTIGSEVISDMLEMPVSTACISQLTQMLYCPHCQRATGPKPCDGFCVNIVSGCLASYVTFDRLWNEYLDHLLQLLERLEGPYNIETVINPIDIQISEAIMIFQDKGKEISDKVFAGCGRPKLLSRVKRQPKMKSVDLKELRFGPVASRPNKVLGTSMDRLAKEMKEKALPAKNFWRSLPDKVCAAFEKSLNWADIDDDGDECWNGTGLQEGGSARPTLSSHVEEEEDGTTTEPTIQMNIEKMKRAIGELKKVITFEPTKLQPKTPTSVWSSGLAGSADAASLRHGGSVDDAGAGYGNFYGSGQFPASVQTDDEDLVQQLAAGGHNHLLEGSGTNAISVLDSLVAAGMAGSGFDEQFTSPSDLFSVENPYSSMDFHDRMRMTAPTPRPMWIEHIATPVDGHRPDTVTAGYSTTPTYLFGPFTHHRDYDDNMHELATPPPTVCAGSTTVPAPSSLLLLLLLLLPPILIVNSAANFLLFFN
ncbi:Glypican-4 [Trichinella sp. T6]|nr:Glypican-4 [Trichinella sp. T6]KRX74521.1 Glypican-4 [Trichinella sp. T6]KRX74522.1 Glypican-4 [Trichinella sp. T6]